MPQVYVQSCSKTSHIALLEQGEVCELYSHAIDAPQILSNVYRGKVTRVLPDMQAAFIDIGLQRPGFLHQRHLINNSVAIDRQLHQGQSILVQVSKEPRGHGDTAKGAALTADIKLVAQSLVWLPLQTESKVVTSKKFSAKEVEAVSGLLARLASHLEHGVLIVRSCVLDKLDGLRLDQARVNRIVQELSGLQQRWHSALQNKARAPVLLMQGVPFVYRLASDSQSEILWDDQTSKVAIKTEEDQQLLCAAFGESMLSTLEQTVFRQKLHKARHTAEQRIIKLENGGRIVIDYTEAMTVIDVDTAAATVVKNAHQQTNLLAASEIARQIRLRDISGVVIVDFIDVTEQQRGELLKHTKQQLRRDRAVTTCEANSSLGLFEITRQGLAAGARHRVNV